jgi:hypothetical protein
MGLSCPGASGLIGELYVGQIAHPWEDFPVWRVVYGGVVQWASCTWGEYIVYGRFVYRASRLWTSCSEVKSPVGKITLGRIVYVATCLLCELSIMGQLCGGGCGLSLGNIVEGKFAIEIELSTRGACAASKKLESVPS